MKIFCLLRSSSFPPASAADAPPPAPLVAPLSGPKIFVLSPIPGNQFDVDWYFYSPAADVSEGGYAALLAFAAHYGHPLAISMPRYRGLSSFSSFGNYLPFLRCPSSHPLTRARASVFVPTFFVQCLPCLYIWWFGVGFPSFTFFFSGFFSGS